MDKELVLRSASLGNEPQHVFIVDDRVLARLLLEGLARALVPAVVIESFSNARGALQRMQQKTPDLIITDYCMPDMNGVELIKEVRAMPGLADVSIVMVTTSNDLTLYHAAMEDGATDFHMRPLDLAKASARWSELLALRRANKNTPVQE